MSSKPEIIKLFESFHFVSIQDLRYSFRLKSYNYDLIQCDEFHCNDEIYLKLSFTNNLTELRII